jgi:hypothetical protein
MTTNTVLHLADAGREREKLAVDGLLTLVPALHPRWFNSLGIDAVRHWCLVRAILKGVHSKQPEVEIDIILGNLGLKTWSPSVELLVAVEAKCWVVRCSDAKYFAKGPHAKTNLWDQVKRNVECGFDRVAGLDIVSTEPSRHHLNALGVANTLGSAEMGLLDKAYGRRLPTTAGYAVFAFGAVSWKDEGASGALPMLKCVNAPALERHNRAVENAVRTTLEACPEPRVRPPYHFACPSGDWQIVPALC